MASRDKNENPFVDENKEYGIKKGDILYFNRIIPNCGIYDLLETKVRTIADTWFCVTEKHTKQAFIFSFSALGKRVFKDRKEALKEIKKAEKNRKIEIGDCY